ncbi:MULTISPECIES: hypothetical protein [Cyanophyceae]|nr:MULTISPECIES: hypothetical protein [unclassified Coleofasciculus]
MTQPVRANLPSNPSAVTLQEPSPSVLFERSLKSNLPLGLDTK